MRYCIIGAGSVGGYVASNFDDFGLDGELLGFLDDDREKWNTIFSGYRVLGSVNDLAKFDEVGIIIGIAFPKIKKKILGKIGGRFHFPSLVHPRAWVSKNVEIGKGVIVYPGCSINYGSNIGDFVVMNMNCAIGHHTCISEYSSLAPSVATGGHTFVESAADLGIGSVILQSVRIGESAVVGGQTIVTKDVEAGSRVKGIPARKF